ncbi:hypothetical protein EG68_03813 [Paragonimus skrjabini miyazakii]|uniref:Uncharacterized protein n=1 Tax=Paragonimus skrjabini miyazakii TaxID=59628 RepID=A0A8S9YV42_9TREM|nr:hypothetical protein EG68_03813 [Paragonimus skrjabini miyazakii]
MRSPNNVVVHIHSLNSVQMNQIVIRSRQSLECPLLSDRRIMLHSRICCKLPVDPHKLQRNDFEPPVTTRYSRQGVGRWCKRLIANGTNVLSLSEITP